MDISRIPGYKSGLCIQLLRSFEKICSLSEDLCNISYLGVYLLNFFAHNKVAEKCSGKRPYVTLGYSESGS